MGARIKEVHGNWFSVAIPLKQRVATSTNGEVTVTETPFTPKGEVQVLLRCQCRALQMECTVSGSIVIFSNDGTLPCGLYDVEIRCKDSNDKPCRFFSYGSLEIVHATYEADVIAGASYDAETHTLDGSVFLFAKGEDGAPGVGVPTGGTEGQVLKKVSETDYDTEWADETGGEQVQSDWNQSDTEAVDYIKNKPTIPAEQIQSDWNQSSTSAKDYIKNKPTIPDVSGKADKATTLAGYGITDAKIVSGTITLGSDSITPVTDISGKQDKIDSSHKLSADLVQDGSTNKVYTATEQSKLSGIAAGAEVNVQANWNESDTSSDAYIQNKPTIPDVSNLIAKSDTAGLVKNDGTIDTNTYLTSAHEVPSGGNSGQVLKKSSATDYDYAWANQTQDYPSAYCTTAAGTAAKKASCSLYAAQANSYLHVLIGAANTSASAITLNVNSAGAKPIYINGEASSSTNYTLPAGTYIVFYDGTNYYFRTDGKIQASATTVLANTSEISGKEDKMAIDSTAKTASFSASVGTYYFVNIAASGSVTITLTTPADNTKVSACVFRVSTSTSPSLTISAASGVDIYVGSSYSIEASKVYEINALWNGVDWSILCSEIQAQS